MSSSESAVDLTIRSAAPEDTEALAELWEVAGLLSWWSDPRDDIARLRDSDHAEVFTGWTDGRLVASVCASHDDRRGWLTYLAVHPAFHGLGYGRQMVRAAELWLSEKRLRKVNAVIRARNQQAFGFCRALGYNTEAVGMVSRWLDRPPLPPETVAEPDAEGKLEVTTTYLEMTAPPGESLPHPPAGQRVALMRAERPPVSFYRFLYNTIGEPWLWWERRALDDAALARVIQDDRIEIYVLYVDGVPAGYAELDRRRGDRININFFGIMPAYIGRGFGSYLLGAAIDIAWSYRPERVTVDTCTLDHPRALPLYQRFGFVPVSRSTKVIDDPRITGLIPVT